MSSTRGWPSIPQEPGSAEAEGHARALESLSARLRAPLKRYFEKHGVPRDEIDDLVQDVFVRLASHAGLDSTERLDAYVFKSASNLLHDRYRRRKVRAAGLHDEYDEEVHGAQIATFDPHRLVGATQSIEQLVAALQELPERTRAAFVLYHLECLSHQEIGRRLGMAVSTIEKHMARANAHLLKRMDR